MIVITKRTQSHSFELKLPYSFQQLFFQPLQIRILILFFHIHLNFYFGSSYIFLFLNRLTNIRLSIHIQYHLSDFQMHIINL